MLINAVAFSVFAASGGVAAAAPSSSSRASADLAISIEGPGQAGDHSSFTKRVIVINRGPDSSGQVAISIQVPTATKVVSAPGAFTNQYFPHMEFWNDPSLRNGDSVVHKIVYSVDGGTHGSASITTVTASGAEVYDPHHGNNKATVTIQLG